MPSTVGIISSAGSLKNPAEPALLGYRVNYIDNPSMETDISLWQSRGAGTTVAKSTTESYSGSASLEVTLANVTNAGANFRQIERLPVSSGQHTFSVYVKVNSSDEGNRNIRVRYFLYEAIEGGSSIGGTTGTAVSVPHNTWTRVSQTFNVIESGANYIVLTVERPVAAEGDIMYVDAALLENVATLGSYFDGSSNGFWTGSVDASYSGASPY